MEGARFGILTFVLPPMPQRMDPFGLLPHSQTMLSFRMI